jgi:DNA polymerase-3 subunit epsilon
MVFQPEVAVNDAAAVHCILPSDTRSGLPEPLVIEQLLPDLQGSILVGHHVQFDAALLDEALRKRFQVRLRNPIVDTAKLAMIAIDAFAKTGYPGQRPPTFDEVCTHVGLEMIDRHTAAGDAFTTAELFLLLCARLRQRYKRPLVAGDLPFASV